MNSGCYFNLQFSIFLFPSVLSLLLLAHHLLLLLGHCLQASHHRRGFLHSAACGFALCMAAFELCKEFLVVGGLTQVPHGEDADET